MVPSDAVPLALNAAETQLPATGLCGTSSYPSTQVYDYFSERLFPLGFKQGTLIDYSNFPYENEAMVEMIFKKMKLVSFEEVKSPIAI